jgi:hypothetical protein
MKSKEIERGRKFLIFCRALNLHYLCPRFKFNNNPVPHIGKG